MAEEPRDTTEELDEEAEFAKWIEELPPEVDEAEEEADRADQTAVKIAKQTNKVVKEFITEQKTEEMVDKFMAEASATAKDLFAIYRTGDEDPKQLKRIMDLARTKAEESEKPAVDEEQIEQMAEEKARQIARNEFGAGPITPGSSGEVSPRQYFDQQRERIRKGDMHAAFDLWNGLRAEGGPTSPD